MMALVFLLGLTIGCATIMSAVDIQDEEHLTGFTLVMWACAAFTSIMAGVSS